MGATTANLMGPASRGREARVRREALCAEVFDPVAAVLPRAPVAPVDAERDLDLDLDPGLCRRRPAAASPCVSRPRLDDGCPPMVESSGTGSCSRLGELAREADGDAPAPARLASDLGGMAHRIADIAMV